MGGPRWDAPPFMGGPHPDEPVSPLPPGTAKCQGVSFYAMSATGKLAPGTGIATLGQDATFKSHNRAVDGLGTPVRGPPLLAATRLHVNVDT